MTKKDKKDRSQDAARARQGERQGKRLPVPSDVPLLVPLGGDVLPLLALDPGETTGVCVLSVPRLTIFGEMAYSGIHINWYDQITGDEEEQAAKVVACAEWIASEYEGLFPAIIEDFSLRTFSRDESLLSPVRLIRLARSEIRKSSVGDRCFPFLQQPSMAKRTVSDARLKKWGLYFKGQQHARDSLRHGITFYRRAVDREHLREMAWGDGRGRTDRLL